ncbi:MAG: YraN family protein [Candidatus Aminicenantes bacterium]|nr:YraN family protein [Candidatus Aminicenantes bacterium]
MSPFELGKMGEQFAFDYLKKKKYKIIKKGFRLFRGDIDLIAYDKDVLVFVEVKTRRGVRFGLPEESVDSSKKKQIRKIARGFVSLNRLDEVECRFDILALNFHPAQGFKATHFKDAF